MADIAHTVHVALGERAYDILIGDRLLDEAGAILAERFPGRRYGIITDETVARELRINPVSAATRLKTLAAKKLLSSEDAVAFRYTPATATLLPAA